MLVNELYLSKISSIVNYRDMNTHLRFFFDCCFFVKDIHLFPQSELLQLNCGILDEHHVAGLNERVDQLLTQTRQFVLMDDWKSCNNRKNELTTMVLF